MAMAANQKGCKWSGPKTVYGLKPGIDQKIPRRSRPWPSALRNPPNSLATLNRDGFQHYIFHGPVLAVALDIGNFHCDVLSFHYFAKDSVVAGKVGSRSDCDKKLRA